MFPRVFIGVVALAATACVENVAYRVFVLDEYLSPHLVSEGEVEYWPAVDVLVAEGTGEDGVPFWSKGIAFVDDWLLVAHVTKDTELTSFGLGIRNTGNPRGFSWEWFDKIEGDLFRKRQGAGEVRAFVERGPDYQELIGVEFLDDVTLRYLDDISNHDPGDHTHEILIREGSVLRLAP